MLCLARPDLVQLDHSEAVAEICRRLDGLPLAIELAAAQVQAFDPADIAARLEDRFRLLQRPSPDLGRHHSLRATIAWSHELALSWCAGRPPPPGRFQRALLTSVPPKPFALGLGFLLPAWLLSSANW